MHPDEGATDVQSCIRPDLLQRHRMPKRLVSGGGEGAARLGLGHHIDDLPAGDRLVFHDQSPVQMLAALGSHVDAHGAEHTVKAPENGIRHLRCRPASHLMPYHLTGTASDDHELSLPQMGSLRQLAGRSGGLPLYLFQKLLILQRMYRCSCHI